MPQWVLCSALRLAGPEPLSSLERSSACRARTPPRKPVRTGTPNLMSKAPGTASSQDVTEVARNAREAGHDLASLPLEVKDAALEAVRPRPPLGRLCWCRRCIRALTAHVAPLAAGVRVAGSVEGRHHRSKRAGHRRGQGQGRGGLDDRRAVQAAVAGRPEVRQVRAVSARVARLPSRGHSESLLTPPGSGCRCCSVLVGVRDVLKLPDPIGGVTRAVRLDEGLDLYRVTCPIGVVCVIFEARPDAAVQISSLALKSANAIILKGVRHRLCLVFPLRSCLRHCLSLRTSRAGRRSTQTRP